MAGERTNLFSRINVNNNRYDNLTLNQIADQSRGQLGHQSIVDTVARNTVSDGQMNRDDWRTLLNPQEEFSREQWASHLRKEGYIEAAEAYEKGAVATASTVILPVEEHSQSNTDDGPKKTTFAYLVDRLPSREMAREFHEHIQVIQGQDPGDNQTKIIDQFLKPILFNPNGGYRSEADQLATGREVIAQMRELATALKEVDPNFRPVEERTDIMDRGVARGDSEIILENRGQVDEEFERIEAEDRELYDYEREAFGAFNPIQFEATSSRGGENTDEQDRSYVEDQIAEREEVEIERADQLEQPEDFDRVREGMSFSTASIRISGQDNVVRLPYDNQVITDKFIAGEVLPRINEELRQGVSRNEIVRDARELSYVAAQYLDRRAEVEGLTRTNPTFNEMASRASEINSVEGVRQFRDQLSQSNLTPHERTLILQSQAEREDLRPQFQQAILETTRQDYRNGQVEAAQQALNYVVNNNEARNRPLPSEQREPREAFTAYLQTQNEATRSYTERAVEYYEARQKPWKPTPFNQLAERIEQANTPAQVNEVARAIAASELALLEKTILLLPGPHTAHHDEKMEQALGLVVRDFNEQQREQSKPTIRTDNLFAEYGQTEREGMLAQSGHLQKIINALAGKRTEEEFTITKGEGEERREYTMSLTTSAISGSVDSIKQEYQQLPYLIDNYSKAALQQDFHLRASNESNFYRLAFDELAKAKDVARVEKVASRIVERNQALAQEQREGQVNPEFQKLDAQQRSALSLPGPHTRHYNEEMMRSLRHTLMPPHERELTVQTFRADATQMSKPLQELTCELHSRTHENGVPDDKAIKRFLILMKHDQEKGDHLTRPMNAREQALELNDKFKQLTPLEKDFLWKEINTMRAEAIAHNPALASERTQLAAKEIAASRDSATLEGRLTDALSKQNGKEPLAHEQIYLKGIAKQTEQEMGKQREEHERPFAAIPTRSQSYRDYVTALESAKDHDRQDVLAGDRTFGVRVIEGTSVTVRNAPEVTATVTRTYSEMAWQRVTERFQDSLPGEKGYEVLRQAETMQQLQKDAIAARDAYNGHNDKILNRVAAEKGEQDAKGARYNAWTESWQQAMNDKSTPEKVDLRNELVAHKQEIGNSINLHVRGEITQSEFERRAEKFPDATREFLREAVSRSDMAGDVAHYNAMELTKDDQFRTEALKQATPLENEYKDAYRNSMETACEKFYNGFEKMDTLIAQADGRTQYELGREGQDRFGAPDTRTEQTDQAGDRTNQIIRNDLDTDTKREESPRNDRYNQSDSRDDRTETAPVYQYMDDFLDR